MKKCENCPMLGDSRPCASQCDGMAHLCSLAAEPLHRPLLVSRSVSLPCPAPPVAAPAEPGPPDAPPDRPSLPPLWEQAVSVISTTFTHVVSGCKNADDATYEARIEACGRCDHLIPGAFRCGRLEGQDGCGCFLKKKARMLNAACDLGRWPGGLSYPWHPEAVPLGESNQSPAERPR